ncbi:putative CRAL-TRIO lipid binding domain, CRAL/TRIO domain, CRAL/TRIO domain superfamily, patellin [Helianthus debilis subsp. tardiflorus]
MAQETVKTVAQSETPADVAVVSEVPEAEKVETCAKETVVAEPEKVAASISFKEETNVVGELPDPQKKALDELKLLVQEALNKHEFSAPPASPQKVAKEEQKAVSAVDGKAQPCELPPVPAKTECKKEEKDAPPTPVPESEPVEKEVTEVVVKTESESCIDEDGAKKIEAIQETIVKTEQTQPPPPPCVAEVTPVLPEEVSIWGIPLLADERSDVILLKFLRARDFKVKEAFTMLKNVVAWRKEFNIESLLEEDLGTEQEKVVYMHGVDKEGHPVCYNAFGEYQNKELYQETFSDDENRKKFIRWRIQFLERSIRKLDFSPDGISTIVQINDLKYSPAPFKKELRQVFQLLQDNYPEFVAKQVFINVPWWYLAFYKMINPFFTQRTKSKFVFAGPSKTTETLFKYISPELVPVQYGGLSREGEQEFTTSDCITEDFIKPSCEHAIELPAPEACTLVWEARVVGIGCDVSYGAEFVPSAEDGYTVIVQKSRKVTGDESVICGRFKCGETGKVVLTFFNQSSKKKKVLYRFKKVAFE